MTKIGLVIINNMENCVFCKIVNKKIPANIVYEDQDFLAFLDIRPHSPGHTQVIPKKHFRWVWDLPKDNKSKPNISEYFKIVTKIALAQRKAFKTDWIMSKIIGDEIPHAHIWVFPSIEIKADKNDFEANQKIIVDALGQ